MISLTSVDPLADAMVNWSPYSYSFNNPLTFSDPTGLIPEEGDDPPFTVTPENSHLLDEVEITPDDDWTSEAQEWSFVGDLEDYQKLYPEYRGLSKKQAQEYWERYDEKDFYKNWEQEVAKERQKNCCKENEMVSIIF